MALIPDGAYANAFTLRVGQTDQSYVDLDDPFRLEFDYVQRMADVIDSAFEAGVPVRTVHVGGAGLTLPRYLAASRPTSAQVVLEPDAGLTDFVRAELPLPKRSGIKVRSVDGRLGITDLRDAYAEALVIDAFVGPLVPAELGTTQFFAQARRVLTPSGLLIMNITDRGPFDYARRIVTGLTSSFAYVALCAEPSTLKGRRFGNVIAVASPVALPLQPLAERAGQGPFPYRVIHGSRLEQLRSGARPFVDADSESSPAPPRGMTHFA